MPQLEHTLTTQAIQPIQQRRKVLAGLIGQGIQGSRTPAMHQAEGERLGLH